MPVSRRLSLLALAVMTISTLPVRSPQAEGTVDITVYKTPTCGCCKAWVSYLEDNGFRVIAHDLNDLSQIKRQYGVDPRVSSCHTALIDGYVVEGHVPVNDIRRLLNERPGITGISAPGMPQLSPGMYSIEPKDYDVVSFDDKGNIGLFSRY